MPSTNGLIHHDLSGVAQGNNQVAAALTGKVTPAANKLRANPFAAALGKIDMKYNTHNAADTAHLTGLIKSVQGKNSNSSGIMMCADGENGAAMNKVVTV